MTEAEKAVEDAKVAAAAAEPNEFEKQLAEKDALILKISSDRDNYKKGMLKAKGKLKDDGTPEFVETDEEKFDRMFQEKMLDTQLSQANKEKDDIIKSAAKRISELETALKNRGGIVTAGSGSGSATKLIPKDPVLSEDIIATLKSKGWDDKKIDMYKKNLVKLR